jgi:hypothetical protein
MGAKFPGCVKDVGSVMNVTSLPLLRRLVSSRRVLVDDLQPKTKIQTKDYTYPSA